MAFLRVPGSIFFALVVVVSFSHDSVFAEKRSYIVYLGGHTHAPEHAHLHLDRVKDSHHDLLGSIVGSSERAKDLIFHSYANNINGFAAILEEEDAKTLARHPDVISVFPNQKRKLLSTHSWSYLGLEDYQGIVPDYSAWKKARFGEDVIIANIDTGVWPEAASFNDESMGPVPSRWKGVCQKLSCNKKLIGARYFNHRDGRGPSLNGTNDSPYDDYGHGTTTLSIAGGSFVPGVIGNGIPMGTAKGGSPKARVASYKACWIPDTGDDRDCYDTDIVAAFDAAISDGVDIMNVSLEPVNAEENFGNTKGHIQKFHNGIDIGAFHAVSKGMVVVCAAGNSGDKGYGSILNNAPWVVTVAYSTTDRGLYSNIILGNNVEIKGKSISSTNLPSQRFYPLINSADAMATNATIQDAQLCKIGSLDATKVRGKIVVCLHGEIPDLDKGTAVAQVGAVGMILANAVNQTYTSASGHLIPTSHITYSDGVDVFNYIKSAKSAKAYITRTRMMFNSEPTPIVSYYSSKGPNTATPEILKPDITAPGYDILNAYVPTKRNTSLVEGSSLSSPHVVGVAGLVKTLHPDWSPAAIKSAIMTTAKTQHFNGEPILNSTGQIATPFECGAGEVSPNNALYPGLVYDLTVEDYLNFLCAIGFNATQLKVVTNHTYVCMDNYNIDDFNYPSITLPRLTGTTVVHRRVKNVGSPGIYHVSVDEPDGISVSVVPKMLVFKKIGQEEEYIVTLKVNGVEAPRNYVFGSLTWSDGNHSVRSPIVVKGA